jgi:integrase
MSRIFRHKGEWWIDFKDARGVRRRKKIGPSKRIAREVLNGYLGKVAQHQHLGIIEESAISFADFIDVWSSHVMHELKPSTQRRWRGILRNHLKPTFGSSALRTISQAQIESYRAERRRAGASPATVNRETSMLKAMLRRAVKWQYLTLNQIAEVKPLKEPDGRNRWATSAEIDRLLAACEYAPLLKAFVLIALNTGMRLGEILSISRKAVDWHGRFVTLTKTKNGSNRVVFLNDLAYQALRAQPVPLADDAPLFPFTANQVSKAFARAAKRAGLSDFRLHDCRHTFASHQAMSGVQGRSLMELLGHKDPRMTVRYSHLSSEHLRAAVNAISLGGSKDGTYLAPPQTGTDKV